VLVLLVPRVKEKVPHPPMENIGGVQIMEQTLKTIKMLWILWHRQFYLLQTLLEQEMVIIQAEIIIFGLMELPVPHLMQQELLHYYFPKTHL